MTTDRQIFRRTLAEAVASLLGRKYATAKQIARGVGIDPATAENIRKGNLSVTTLAGVLLAEGRGFYQALGDEIYGEDFAEYEERRLLRIIKEATDAHETVVRIRRAREALEQDAADLDALDARQVDVEGRGGRGRSWSPADEPRHRQARGQNSARKQEG